jgi:hypothetical protein
MAAFQTWYGQQQGGNRPEDMDRFLQTDTLNRWNPYLVTSGANAGQYRSMRGAEGYFDKPTECPPGMYPSGPNETDPCVGGGGQQAPKQDAATAMGQGSQPAGQAGFLGGALSQALPQMMTQLQGQVSQSPASQPSAALGNMGGTLAPMMSSLQGLVGGQSQAASGAPKAGTMQTGWSSTAGGLQNMMAPLQKQKRVGSWF